jgi:hypothetical protein
MLWAAVYPDVDAALQDLEAFERLHEADLVGKYDAAVIDKENGKAKIVKRVDRPRIRVIPETLGSGNLPSDELKTVADQLGSGEAGLIVVGEATLDTAVEQAVTQAARVVKHDVTAATDALTDAFKE